MDVVKIIMMIILNVVSLVLIGVVLMQQGEKQGLGAIAGGAESFFGKNKAKSYEGKLSMLTKVSAVIFVAISFVLLLLQKFGA